MKNRNENDLNRSSKTQSSTDSSKNSSPTSSKDFESTPRGDVETISPRDVSSRNQTDPRISDSKIPVKKPQDLSDLDVSEQDESLKNNDRTGSRN